MSQPLGDYNLSELIPNCEGAGIFAAGTSFREVAPMCGLVVISLSSESQAADVRRKVLEMHRDYLICVVDAVAAVKKSDGRIKLKQLYHPAASGAAYGTLWGFFAGLIFAVPLIGAAAGAASGALAGAFTDVGLNNKFIKDAAASIDPGSAALFLLIKKITGRGALEDLRDIGGRLLTAPFEPAKEDALRAAFEAAIAAQSPVSKAQAPAESASGSPENPAIAKGASLRAA